MQHDFTLAANASTTIDVAGKFFKYKSGTALIRVRDSKGGFVDLLPGQGVWGIDFTSLTISDKSGAANAGVILAGAFDFHDDRIAGTVDVVDGGRSRTLAGTAFAGVTALTPTAGQYCIVGLSNPVGSGKNVYVEQLVVSANTTGEFGVVINTAIITDNIGSPSSPKAKRAGAAASVAVYVRASQVAGGTPGAVVLDTYCTANQPFIYKFIEPLMLPPGSCLGISHAVANATVILTTEHFEEPIV